GHEQAGQRDAGDDAEDGQERERDGGGERVAQDLHRHSTSTIISISTGICSGSEPMPTAERACLPMVSPKTSTIRSEKPLITFGCSPNSSVQFTMPSTLTMRLTL